MSGKRLILIIAFVELAIVALLLPGCFREKQLIYEMTGEKMSQTVQVQGNQMVFTGDTLVLSPGVYRVCVNSNITEDRLISVELYSEDMQVSDIKENIVHIRPYENEMDFEVYVLHTLQWAHVRCYFQNIPVENLIGLQVYKTNMGSRMLLFLAVVVMGVLDGLLYGKYKIRKDAQCKENQYIVWALLGAAILTFYPYLSDYMILGADTLFQVLRIEGLKESLLNGCPWPIRVQDYWLFHHGYAVSFFYGDMLLVIPAMMRLLGFPIMTAYKAHVLIMILATVLIAYITMKKCVGSSKAALFGAVFYTLTPYHIMDIYNRGAMGEYMAMAFTPLVCCGTYLLLSKETTDSDYKRHKWWLIMGMSCLLHTHLLSTEMTIVLLAVTCIVFWKRTFRKDTFLQFFQAVIITMLLNCWFWVPMLYMLAADTYKMEAVLADPMQCRGSAIGDLTQLLPHMGKHFGNLEPIHLGAAAFMIIGFMLALLYKGKKRERKADGQMFLTILILVLYILTTKYFPWDYLQNMPLAGSLVAPLQFPTRWLLPLMILLAMLGAFMYRRLQQQCSVKVYRCSVLLFYLVIIGSALYLVNDVCYSCIPVRLYSAENIGAVSVVNGEYLLEGDDLGDYYPHAPKATDGLVYQDYFKKGTEATVYVENITDKELYLELPITGYKGYAIEDINRQKDAGEAIRDDGKQLPYLTEERGEHGDLRIAVPAGYAGTLRVWYRGFWFFRAAEGVSLATVLGLSVLGLYKLLALRRALQKDVETRHTESKVPDSLVG